ncbi:rhizopine catabolism protein mocC [Asticcacaulis biprosthecium C19]|uniref:Rhizopine catabolism protein mocC n=1 Tax=Asticcacaulis biprosthecium C19 TaxID=715226 RepID=F4QU89_9CAUL|nr:myo-inosose-2 dehydratase [Asticcacaulis biprosthecium]EGF89389.1 rhizopine catabolism protein mocC [Asticcacaulis biprosthecium C19]
MTITFGVSPIAWINDDMPELGGDTPLDSVLKDITEVGFAGSELGGAFPKDPAELKSVLGRFNLDLVGGWYSCELLTRDAEAEIAALQGHLALLRALGSKVFVIAETSNAIHGQRNTPLNTRPHLDEAGWVQFGARLSAVADYVAAHGLKLAYHYHLGTVVQDAEDLQNFFRHTRANVGVTLDTGHAVLGGIDPHQVIADYPERVTHVHCKDVRQAVFDATAGKDDSFLNGVLAGMFTVPGDGSIDFDRVMTGLKAIGYSGWIIIEAEQDPAKADPRTYAELGLKTLKDAARKAGLIEAVAA